MAGLVVEAEVAGLAMAPAILVLPSKPTRGAGAQPPTPTYTTAQRSLSKIEKSKQFRKKNIRTSLNVPKYREWGKIPPCIIPVYAGICLVILFGVCSYRTGVTL